jgi:ATP-dependent DNA helicase RecQ
MKYDQARALELLRAGTGIPDAVFREGQEEAIRHVVEGRGRLLLVQRTGWGKSNVYFIATKLLREQVAGPALLISPLLSLMRNQIAAAERMGVRALTIHSGNKNEWENVKVAVRRNEVDILLISPERLANLEFITDVLGPLSGSVSMLIVDEAHCISDWGHDFRPDYRRIERILRTLPPNLRVMATTATANRRVMDDLQKVLGPNLHTSVGDLLRTSLTLQTIPLPDQAQRLAWLAENVPLLEGSGIIYTLTVRDTELVARWLQAQGIDVAAYSGQMGDERIELEQALLENHVKALVATTALGMGYDKPDLSFVIHYQTPGSVVHYYQQVGRAGRAIPHAYGILLSGTEDTNITDYFIDTAFPSRQDVQEILKALGAADEGMTVADLERQVNARRGRIEHSLKLLSLESPAPVVKDGSRWFLTTAFLGETFWQRVERLTDLRRQEQQQMQEYVNLSSGHMEFLLRALDSETNVFQNPRPALNTETSQAMLLAAQQFLRRLDLPIEPREKWPKDVLKSYNVSGNIRPEHQALPGRALSMYGDAGWGALVKTGKYIDHHFSDGLVTACAELVGHWQPQPAPTWITCIPSLRHQTLVPDFAQRLASALHLPFHPVIRKTAERPPQKDMANSAHQALNLDGAFQIVGGTVPRGPVLLVDDIVDSRWTMTVGAWLLRSHGSGEVFPLALAVAGGSQ